MSGGDFAMPGGLCTGAAGSRACRDRLSACKRAPRMLFKIGGHDLQDGGEVADRAQSECPGSYATDPHNGERDILG